MSLPAYDVFKVAPVEWLGPLPAHWGAAAIKRLVLTPITDGPHETPQFHESGIPFVSAEAVGTGKINFEKIRGYISSEDHLRYSRKYFPKKNDIFLVKSGATTGVSAIVEVDTEFNIWSPLAVVRCDSEKIIPHFMLYALRSRNFLDGIALNWSYGTQQNIGMGVLERLHVPLPPKSEQEKIVAFLNGSVSKVDSLIEKKTRFIALLKEKRAAVITHAVTKGIDPDAPIKDSGVDWLGRVPAHWEVLRIAALFREVSRPADPALPVLSVSIHDGVTDGELADEDRDRKVALSEDRTKYQGVAPGDLVYNMMRAWQGAFGAVTVKGLVSPAYVVAAPVTTFRTKFIEHLLHTKSAAEEIRRFSRGIADFRMRLYWDHFRALKVCLPPLEEQDRILSEIDTESARIDGLIALTERSIDLLREKRAALITAAVTGKIDVRAAA
ncbi:restriction endonuclease subunit S [Rhodobacter capsulatus]|uniref:Restriction endonuclease subunit S n=1 Tax=Rhodobacter capsulatus TaxID=1061 RepID=A0A4U1K078_RHOCA|nr:restriction endonuclease subunit S [Rhodobacter capsulatus]TKD25304.1 restriction endonuclease subunit S [Rhodobacter capsulatus]